MKNIQSYHSTLTASEKTICEQLQIVIDRELNDAESKIWHGHPVWFLDGNPIVGYSKQRRGIRLMFWSGQGFDEEQLEARGEKYKDASIFYTDPGELQVTDIKRWLAKSKLIQWDYKNIVKRKGVLKRLK